MTYPLDSMTWIAPAIFLLLIIAAPIIGVVAGWKRAAYWGGGFFLFFLLGVIIWKTLGTQIVHVFDPILTKVISSISPSVQITTRLLVSVSAPIFFLFVMFVGELFLLINYYAWFKKISGIKKDIQVKQEYKQNHKTKGLKGWNAMQLTTKGKVINIACGGAGLALLLAPSTITFTQALLYTTTSVETRANNKFASDFYNAMQTTITPFSWMSYYDNGDTAKDYNSLFSLLALSNNTTTYTYFDSNGKEITSTGNVTEAITNVVAGGIQTIIKKTTEGGATTEEKVQATNESITSLAKQWNTIVDANTTSVNSVFSSESVTEILKNVIGDTATSKQQITEQQIVENYLTEGSVFNQVYDYYVNERPEDEKLTQISVSQQTFNNLVDSINKVVIVSDDTSETVKKQFQDKLADCVALIFKVVE